MAEIDVMSRLDLVIFGATGFTGMKVVEQLATVAKKYPAMTWGVAGRSEAKLKALMADIGKKIGEDLTGIRIILAEVTNERSLRDMCEQAKVLINCCGPYLMYGEPVVKAAVEAKTHCVDVSGEPQAGSAGRSPLSKKHPKDLPVFEPKLRTRSTIHKLEDQWCVPFPGVDESVVYRTQRFFHDHENQRVIQFKTYVKLGSLCTVMRTGFAGVLIALLSKTAPTMKLLLKYPKLFSGGMVTLKGPTENVMNNTKFTFELYGVGWDKNTDVSGKPNKKAVVKRWRSDNWSSIS
ncbi:saccharopine dehydrogenase-like oxidoreductase [Cydia fagiglandana]|uniref:saccharopine dehydrogenase-like oxidoreductase n=1 Tax=Cydia fagiglandana TaxID=1458189 RepID=UPI002FEE4DC9